jgi:hypothetical protein
VLQTFLNFNYPATLIAFLVFYALFLCIFGYFGGHLQFISVWFAYVFFPGQFIVLYMHFVCNCIMTQLSLLVSKLHSDAAMIASLGVA